jgi:hypothetical protein
VSQAIIEHARRLWLAGADLDSIARTIGTHRAAIATVIIQLDEDDLLSGLRLHLQTVVSSRQKGNGTARPVKSAGTSRA